jgi:hypothetical protein
VITGLRARHIAFLTERLTDDRARGDFLRSLEAGYDHVLGLPLRAILPEPKALVSQLDAALTQPVVRGLLSPIVREVHRRVVAALRTDETTLGTFVAEAARRAIDELLARPDIVPQPLVRKIVDEEVVEEIMRDVTYDALREFNDTVNPFFADWGLPALIKRFLPIGSGAVLKSMTAVRGEFDKRLEPEIRKFLLGFSRKAKVKLADFLVGHAADPKMIALRKSVVAYFYGESLQAITKDIDDDARMAIDEAAEEIVLTVLANDHARTRLVAELDKLLAEHGDETVGAWLARIGVTERPAFDALAAVLWPYVKLALESPPARAFWERVTWDFYATLPKEDG